MDTAARSIPRTSRTPLVALLAANSVSLIGTMLTRVALPWFVLQTTGSAAQTGLVGFVVFLPAFAAGIFGGTLVDRLGYKRVSVIADAVSGVTIALIPLLLHTVGLAFWQLLALVFIGSLLDIPGLTARRSILPELAALANWRLERTNASFEAIQNLALLLGPPLAGILIAWLGAANVLWINAMTFMLSAGIVALIVSSPSASRSAATGRYWGELVAGLRFLRRDSVLLALAISVAITNFFSNPLFAVILPVYAQDAFGQATALGLIIGAAGAGSLLGALAFGAVGHRLPRRATWIAAFLVTPVSLWTLSTAPSLSILVAAMFIEGLAIGPINPLMVTIRHERIPPELRGRVFSTFSAVAMATPPLGILLGGNLIEWIGFHPTVLSLAICLQLVGLVMFFIPGLRAMDASKSRLRPTVTSASNS